MWSMLLLLSACTPDNTSDPTGTDTTRIADDTGGSGGTDTAATVTWYRDVRPVVQTYCTRCHTADGSGPFDLTDPEQAVLLAPAMAAAVEDGRMPPPASSPDCREYDGWERLILSEADRQTLIAWADEGAPLGDPADAAPDIAPQSSTLADPDLEIRLPTPYTPAFADAENPGNEYRCFYLEHGQKDDFFITALAPTIDQGALVHHVVLFTLPEDQLPEGYDPDLGVDCIDGMGAVVNSMIAAWAPGMLPITFPEGVGLRVSASERIGVQLHYYASGGAELSDQSGYAFQTAPSVEEEVFMLPLGTTDFVIPAGEERYTHHAELALPDWLWVDATLYGTFPHMHVLGSGYRAWFERDGAVTCLAEADQYDFGNQLTYMFPDPPTVTGGDTLHLECTWNNSASNPHLIHDPPVDIGYGERTDEEMCYAFTLVSLAW